MCQMQEDSRFLEAIYDPEGIFCEGETVCHIQNQVWSCIHYYHGIDMLVVAVKGRMCDCHLDDRVRRADDMTLLHERWEVHTAAWEATRVVEEVIATLK
jgi:hypothetical protein